MNPSVNSQSVPGPRILNITRVSTWVHRINYCRAASALGQYGLQPASDGCWDNKLVYEYTLTEDEGLSTTYSSLRNSDTRAAASAVIVLNLEP